MKSLSRSNLPSDDFIDQFALLSRRPAKIDACRFNRFMPHQVCKKCNVIEFLEKVLCEAMPKGMRVYHFRIHAVKRRKCL